MQKKLDKGISELHSKLCRMQDKTQWLKNILTATDVCELPIDLPIEDETKPLLLKSTSNISLDSSPDDVQYSVFYQFVDYFHYYLLLLLMKFVSFAYLYLRKAKATKQDIYNQV